MGMNGIGTYSYYFSLLSDEQKRIYRALLSAIKRHTKKIRMPIKPINELSKIFNYIQLDNPLIFYVSGFSQSNDLYKGKCEVFPEYTFARHFINEKTGEIINSLQVFDAVKAKSDIEKEQYIHDYCLNNLSYDYKGNEASHSVIGAVLNRTAVCEGIAKFAKLALDYLDVKSLVVSGKANNPVYEDEAMEPHAWNIVDITGAFYHLDVTFDMSVKRKTNRYDYFNLSDKDIKKDHAIIDPVPACSTKGKDYYSVHSQCVHSPSEFERYIAARLKRGEKNIAVKLTDVTYSEKFVDKLLNIAQQQYSAIHKRGVTVEISSNLSQMVFEIIFR